MLDISIDRTTKQEVEFIFQTFEQKGRARFIDTFKLFVYAQFINAKP